MIWDITLRKVLRHDTSRFELDVSFASDATRLAMHGPSGAGKTQTLQMLAGVVHPDSGRVSVAGRVLYDNAAGVDLSPQRRQLAYVFQDYALFPHLSVRQNIAFARRTGWLNPTRTVVDEAADRWIEAFGLQAIAGHYPHQVSGGQRQRTALARALVNNPTALLLDEPFAALDKDLRQRLRDELRDLQSQVQVPMLLITHDDDDVRSLADEAVYMRAGRVVSAAQRELQAAGTCHHAGARTTGGQTEEMVWTPPTR
jgi:molybdate transport system ATP-binding protein